VGTQSSLRYLRLFLPNKPVAVNNVIKYRVLNVYVRVDFCAIIPNPLLFVPQRRQQCTSTNSSPINARKPWYKSKKALLAALCLSTTASIIGISAVVFENKSRLPKLTRFELPSSYLTPTTTFQDNMYRAPEESSPSFWEKRLNELNLVGRIAKLAILFVPVLFTLPTLFLPYVHKVWWKLLRWSLERAGGCWIKLGQWASTRPDLSVPSPALALLLFSLTYVLLRFPEEFVKSVENLQDRCPAHAISTTRGTLKRSLSMGHDESYNSMLQISSEKT